MNYILQVTNRAFLKFVYYYLNKNEISKWSNRVPWINMETLACNILVKMFNFLLFWWREKFCGLLLCALSYNTKRWVNFIRIVLYLRDRILTSQVIEWRLKTYFIENSNSSFTFYIYFSDCPLTAAKKYLYVKIINYSLK